ncbi:MAG: SDR family NAD(P)-dependent oxidoreductase [Solirubrobacterales bacterium]
MKLAGARCVVTGASSGIGLAVAQRLLKAGAVVLAAAVDMDDPAIPLDHPNLHRFACDLSEPAGVDGLFEEARAVLGTVDLFYANAGFAYHERIPEPDWAHQERIFKLNVLSVLYSLQKMRQMRGNRPFFFLQTASAMAFMPLPGYALYGATKAALLRFAECYQYELAPGQVLSTVFPIATRTEFFSAAQSTYVPWPAQDVETVADSILEGLRRNRRWIHPSRLFRLTLVLFTLFPFMKRWYLAREWQKAGL